MKPLVLLLLLFASTAGAGTFSGARPSTTNNDDSCDIATLPAATLLLPYFEVEYDHPQGSARTTLFTVINVTQTPQIAHVTLWTDWSYPALDFNLFLTGYDVQSINLYDVLVQGRVGAFNGTSNQTPVGSRSLQNDANPNFGPSAASSCASLPGILPASILSEVRTAFITGDLSRCGTTHVGGAHTKAIGYITIDVVSTCTARTPDDPLYYNDILYDNVLTGDYEWIDPTPGTGNFAGGNPLVHIRAIPEGGSAGTSAETPLPYTFYDRFTPSGSIGRRTLDRRQPLPSAFTARFIQGGTGGFQTELKIWREGVTGFNVDCDPYSQNAKFQMPVKEIVRFDEHENPSSCYEPPGGVCITQFLPSTSSQPTSSDFFPPMATGSADVAGWIYLNLANNGSANYSTQPNRDFGANLIVNRQNQNWVVVSMTADGRYQTAYDATVLANGCSRAAPSTETGTSPIGPGPNTNP